MQWLQWLAQHLQIVKHNLTENSDTISGLGGYANALNPGEQQDGGGAYSELSAWIAAWKDETKSNLNSLHTLMEQLHECTHLVHV